MKVGANLRRARHPGLSNGTYGTRACLRNVVPRNTSRHVTGNRPAPTAREDGQRLSFAGLPSRHATKSATGISPARANSASGFGARAI